MTSLNCQAMPTALLFEMQHDHPELLENVQLTINITGQQLMEYLQSALDQQKVLLEDYFQRLLHNQAQVKYVTTQELKDDYGISRNRANELTRAGIFTNIIKIGRQNGYLRSEVQAYLSDPKKAIQ